MSQETLADLVPWALGAIVAFIAWLIRLEAKVLYLEKESDKKTENDKLLWDKWGEVQSTLTVILQSLARLEGRLENKNHE